VKRDDYILEQDFFHSETVSGSNSLFSEVELYLRHTVQGQSIRSLAKVLGVHPSTVMRRVRKLENRRDDPLIDQALDGFGQNTTLQGAFTYRRDQTVKHETTITIDSQAEILSPKEAKRFLRRLNEAGAFLALASDMENGVIMRTVAEGQNVRSAVIGRADVQALALNDWISLTKKGRVSRYAITTAGQKALKRLLSEGDDSLRGQGEAGNIFADQHREWAERNEISEKSGRSKKRRVNLAESPITLLSRRRGLDGQPFLSADLVAVGERLREDFELSRMGPSITQNWEKFLTGPSSSYFDTCSGGSGGAVKRFRKAMEALGPGLSEIALHCCCFQTGMETSEKRMGWSARSGKIVLRIALQRLKLHYEREYGSHGPMIG